MGVAFSVPFSAIYYIADIQSYDFAEPSWYAEGLLVCLLTVCSRVDVLQILSF